MTQVAVENQIWNYTEVGEGEKTPLLMLHGWGRNGNEWIQMAKGLSEWSGCKAWVLDLPGFGGSSLPKVKDIVEYSELVAKFCKYMEISKVTVIGHSLGGRVGIVLASKSPTLVEKLVLIDPAGVKPRSIKRKVLQLVAKLVAWIPQEWRRRAGTVIMDEDYRNSPGLRDLYRAVVALDLREYLPKIMCPTWVIWGEKDPLLPLTLTDIYKKYLPHPTVRVIWEAGHDPHLTHPRELTRLLEEIWT